MFEKIERAFNIKRQADQKNKEFSAQKDAIYPLVDMDYVPNPDDPNSLIIGENVCGYVKCNDDWLGSPQGRNHPESVPEKCEEFNPDGPICKNECCPVYHLKHRSYDTARKAYGDARLQQRNAFRAINWN